MEKAGEILFEKKYDGKQLFINQLELVSSLLNDETTPYYVPENEFEKYQKAQTRLKTYISQLLSSTVARSITEDFKTGLRIAISKKLPAEPGMVEEITELIIKDLQEKNAANLKNDIRGTHSEHFALELHNSNYITVITSKPLEIDLPENSGNSPLRRYLFNDLIMRLLDPSKDLKYYRFNFPVITYGQLFWRGLRRILSRYFKLNASGVLFNILYQKFALKTNTLVTISSDTSNSDENIEKIVDETLLFLNRNRYIMVFTSMAPIYSLPMVALEPSDTRNIKVYAMLEMEQDRMTFFKFKHDDVLLWRLFVWDQLKSKKYAGEEVKYSAEI